MSPRPWAQVQPVHLHQDPRQHSCLTYPHVAKAADGVDGESATAAGRMEDASVAGGTEGHDVEDEGAAEERVLSHQGGPQSSEVS